MKSKKAEILDLLKNTYCRLKASKIEGVGIFAIRDIEENTNPFYGVCKRRWHKISKEDLEKLDPEIKKMAKDFFVTDKTGNLLVPNDGLNSIDISFFLNASKKPNVRTTDDGTNFKTSRSIKKGEELTTSYADYDERYK